MRQAGRAPLDKWREQKSERREVSVSSATQVVGVQGEGNIMMTFIAVTIAVLVVVIAIVVTVELWRKL